MRPLREIFLLVPLLLPSLLLGCGAPERPPPPYFVIPPGPPPQAVAPSSSGMPLTLPGPPLHNPEVQYFPPPPEPSEYGRGPAPVPRPAANSQPFYSPPPNLGPVTGYGAGGLQQVPGSPPNPPYPPGGLMH